MSEFERTDAEREAARRARESARANRSGGSVPPPSAAPPRPMARVTPPPAPAPSPSRSTQPAQPPRASTPKPPKPTAAPKPPKPAKPPRAEKPPKPATPRRTVPISQHRRGGLFRPAYAVLGLVLVVIVVIAWFLISLFQPFSGSSGPAVEVTIPPDTSSAEVATLLKKDGVISSTFFFKIRAELSGEHFTAGSYKLAKNMSYGSALSALGKAPTGPKVTNVTIIPGKSRYQLTQLLKSQGVAGDYSASTITSTLLNPMTYGAPKKTPTLEGFLYPDTYQLREPISIPALVADQLTQFKKEMAKVDFTYAQSKNLTPYDVLIIASLVDAEAAKPSDLPKVASVIYNRLKLGMTLGLDTTVNYALNDYTASLTTKQLETNSPWNTTKFHGLPPTPIDSPDLTAIEAAAHPTKTNDTYFIVAVCGNGALAFTNSPTKFQELTDAYNASVAKKGVNKTEFCSSSKHG